MSRLALVSLLASILVLSTPTALAQKVKEKDFSGWMDDYETLVYNKKRNAFMFSNMDKKEPYEKVRLVEVVVYGENLKEDSELAQRSADYLRDGANKIFEEEGVLATEPGPKVAAFTLAITGVEKSVESLKAHNLVPVSAVFRGAKAATGNLNTYIDVMFEAEAVDSVTGERLMAIVAKGIGETSKKSKDELEFEDLIPTLDRWLENYRVTVNEVLAARK